MSEKKESWVIHLNRVAQQAFLAGTPWLNQLPITKMTLTSKMAGGGATPVHTPSPSAETVDQVVDSIRDGTMDQGAVRRISRAVADRQKDDERNEAVGRAISVPSRPFGRF